LNATDSVVALVQVPAMTVQKLQRDGSSGSFTAGTITAHAGDTIQYEIRVTNSGNTPLALSLSDPHCDAGTTHGPVSISGMLSGEVLSPGAEAQYTCSHVLRSSDPSVFTNTATVTGQPPDGSPLVGTSSVSVKKQATRGKHVIVCRGGRIKVTKHRHGKTIVMCVPKKKHHEKRQVIIHRRHTGPFFTG
jgi:uncharacterized repeat protein (TIGR01451 family)